MHCLLFGRILVRVLGWGSEAVLQRNPEKHLPRRWSNTKTNSMSSTKPVQSSNTNVMLVDYVDMLQMTLEDYQQEMFFESSYFGYLCVSQTRTCPVWQTFLRSNSRIHQFFVIYRFLPRWIHVISIFGEPVGQGRQVWHDVVAGSFRQLAERLNEVSSYFSLIGSVRRVWSRFLYLYLSRRTFISHTDAEVGIFLS